MNLSQVTREFARLPPDDRVAAREQLLVELKDELTSVILADPERYTDESLAACYHALASDRFKGLRVEEDAGGSSKRKLEIIRRLELLTSLDTQEKREGEVAAFREDPKRFFDNWVWMRDPRLDGLRDIPFRLFEVQRDLIDFVDLHRRNKRSCMIEKSRDLGVSVIAIGYGCCLWLSAPGAISTYGSRKVDLVHKTGDFDSLLEKAKLLLRYLPNWMMPEGFSFHEHFNYMNVLNPENGSQLKGEGGAELGRGGRATIFWADEFPKVKHQQASHQSLSGTTDCTVYFGTSGGVNTYFYQMKTRGDLPMMKVPWYWDPRKLDDPADVGDPKADSNWKRHKLKELLGNRAAFAQEYECDDSHALESVVIPPEWVRSAVDLKLEPAETVVCGVDVAGEGSDESVAVFRYGGVVSGLETWASLLPKELAPEVDKHGRAHAVRYLYYDRSGIGSSFEGPITAQAGPYDVHGVAGQRPASKYVRYRDDPKKPARERFANKVTELWWSLRLRFMATWEVVTGRVPADTYADDELISIPQDETLILQLSARQWFQNGVGKIQLEDKKKMATSPDRADALAIAEETILQRKDERRRNSKSSSGYSTSGRHEW